MNGSWLPPLLGSVLLLTRIHANVFGLPGLILRLRIVATTGLVLPGCAGLAFLVRPADALAAVLLPNCRGELPAAEPRVELGLDERPEVALGAAFPHRAHLFIEHAPCVVGRQPVPAQRAEDVPHLRIG